MATLRRVRQRCGGALALGVFVLLPAACDSQDSLCALSTPIDRGGGVYVLDFGDVYFQVNSAGARITDVHLQGADNLLSGPAVNATNYGSTFWTSPQSAWGWPPPVEIDSAVYPATVASPRVTFVGSSNAALGASVTKRFAADIAKSRVNVTYEIAAKGADRMFAPWEITRVRPGGLTFFPSGVGPPTAGGGFALPPTEDAAGCTWYQHPASAPGMDQKLFADGTGGWLAHVAGDVVLIKKFTDVPPGKAAPGEAEIELYVQGQGSYVEVEQQGVYQAVAQEHSLSWTVSWIVSRLPAGITPTVGNTRLVQFVQDLVK